MKRDESTAALPAALEMIMPCRWGQAGLAGFGGRVEFRRSFGWPARNKMDERIWLTFDAIEGSAEFWLNDQALGQHDEVDVPVEFDVTNLLKSRNELRVEVEAANDRGGLWKDVALEVRCTAFLCDIHLATSRTDLGIQLTLQGKLVGFADRELELYALLDGSSVIYAMLRPVPEGLPFNLMSEPLQEKSSQDSLEPGAIIHEVRVELVCGAMVWYQWTGSWAPDKNPEN